MTALSHRSVAASRLPLTVQSAFVEWAGLQHVAPNPRVLARIAALERLLDTTPAANLEDVRSRLAWFRQKEAGAAAITAEAYAARLRRLGFDLDEIERASR